ncbi:BREX-1 system adenine-specific DNA-methyltransferase PglX [Acetobacterium wieringae]|uniref:BREX-1 system adenine-specific DNA-methyltransferase PglX n=1 Tax=Acetobacterium wieringae TaxID=52694 RepID=UPI002033DB08|nr:BREX-1 system adenine-specific DNA-methyltransferase PglX [Acetobacterium wieringae]URN84940.1 BREX-1 system adenine-specific DNA-methyltransferase PglX [Acetobacterium wieringae]
MNKTAIKEFAVGARKKLIASVKDKAGKIGITEDNITTAITTGSGFAVFPTHFGTETKLAGKELLQRENLISQIKEKGYNTVMEEVAYTWFNRIIAIRFMEVNDYLPTRVRVLSSETKDKFEPDLVTLAPDIELDFTAAEKDEILSLKMKNELDNLFRMLLIRQCNALGEILPELFENTSTANRHYTEILLDISYTKEDSVIRDLLKIDEADFRDAVEIIGWMYQYYIAEPKEVLINAKKTYKSKEIPFVTQLFTSDWIVRYMVENSLGRLWLEGHDNASLKADWKYYLDEIEQEPEVLAQLEILCQNGKNLSPEDIRVIDPCMGSGHILVYAFEVLMQIYESCGYTQRDAARLIIEKNLYGLDIDDRAFQLAYFAVMMKGRKYNRRILTSRIKTNICVINESNEIKSELSNFIADGNESFLKDTQALIEVFTDAKEYGSILEMPLLDFEALSKRIKEINETVYDNIMDRIAQDDIRNRFVPLLKQAEILVSKYEIVCTNPPYLNTKYMPANLKKYIEAKYSDYKSDMFSAFMVKCSQICKKNGHIGLITPFVWMFISSYEKTRSYLINNTTISSLIQLEYNAFEAACVPVCTFTLRNFCSNIPGEYIKLSDFKGIDVQAPKTLEAVKNRNCGYRFSTRQENFEKIPGMPIAYWVSKRIYQIYDSAKILADVTNVKKGLATGDVELFIKYWYEVNIQKVSLDKRSNFWYPCHKGGDFRKWYGNFEKIINWNNNGEEIKNFKDKNGKLLSRPQNLGFMFKKGIAFSKITSAGTSCRVMMGNEMFDDAVQGFFVKDEELYFSILGLLNSKIVKYFLGFLNPTMNKQLYDLNRIAVLLPTEDFRLVIKSTLTFCQDDWDSFETSWDFKRHPLLVHENRYYASFENDRVFRKDEEAHIPYKHSLALAYSNWETFTENQFAQLKANEEELNRIFIEIYCLEDELTPEVEDKDVTIRKADQGRDIRSLISYAVGCMLGRYSLDIEGLAYAGGDWEAEQYTTIIPDADNIIPITDEEYFDDDMVARLVNFVKVVYGEASLEENLDFIAGALGNKGNNSLEIIRNYFLKDFYKDHLKIYQKRPIYWLFDSGKENGFKALIYMHRYDQDTVGRVRTDYLHKIQAKLEDSLNHCNVILASEAPAAEKAAAVKKKEKLIKQLAETRLYDQAIAHIALSRIKIDLDDGVKVNYAKFQDVEVASEGKKAVKVNLLAKI